MESACHQWTDFFQFLVCYSKLLVTRQNERLLSLLEVWNNWIVSVFQVLISESNEFWQKIDIFVLFTLQKRLLSKLFELTFYTVCPMNFLTTFSFTTITKSSLVPHLFRLFGLVIWSSLGQLQRSLLQFLTQTEPTIWLYDWGIMSSGLVYAILASLILESLLRM